MNAEIKAVRSTKKQKKEESSTALFRWVHQSEKEESSTAHCRNPAVERRPLAIESSTATVQEKREKKKKRDLAAVPGSRRVERARAAAWSQSSSRYLLSLSSFFVLLRFV